MIQQDAKNTVLVVDFGSQVTQLIARRVREHGVHSEVVPFDKSEAALQALKPKALILSGGPSSTYAAKAPRAPDALFRSGLPILGICYGNHVYKEKTRYNKRVSVVLLGLEPRLS